MFDKKPPACPDLVNADYAKIEERLLANMEKTFAAQFGSPTGRKPSEPEMQNLKPLCPTCGRPSGYCGQC